jgi:hypothetical protein
VVLVIHQLQYISTNYSCFRDVVDQYTNIPSYVKCSNHINPSQFDHIIQYYFLGKIPVHVTHTCNKNNSLFVDSEVNARLTYRIIIYNLTLSISKLTKKCGITIITDRSVVMPSTSTLMVSRFTANSWWDFYLTTTSKFTITTHNSCLLLEY